jgi:hypothetical protein
MPGFQVSSPLASDRSPSGALLHQQLCAVATELASTQQQRMEELMAGIRAIEYNYMEGYSEDELAHATHELQLLASTSSIDQVKANSNAWQKVVEDQEVAFRKEVQVR